MDREPADGVSPRIRVRVFDEQVAVREKLAELLSEDFDATVGTPDQVPNDAALVLLKADIPVICGRALREQLAEDPEAAQVTALVVEPSGAGWQLSDALGAAQRFHQCIVRRSSAMELLRVLRDCVAQVNSTSNRSWP